MLWTVTALAAVLAACRAFGIFGALLTWIVAVAYSARFARDRGSESTRLVGDMIWGIFMPLVCLALDPGFFYGQLDGRIWGLDDGYIPAHWRRPELMLRGYAPFIYCAVLLQIAALSLWLIFGSALGKVSAVVAGMLGAGGVLAFFVALFLSPLALIGVLALGIGLLGFTPAFTAWTFLRRFAEAMDTAEDFLEKRPLEWSIAGGFALAIVGPAVFGAAIAAF
jgi:hypothetical protein